MRPEIVIEMLQALTRLTDGPTIVNQTKTDKSNAQIAAELTAPKRGITRFINNN